MAMLQDKIVIVTGASSGIGRAVARLFAAEGAKIVANARGEGPLTAVVEAIREDGGEAIAVSGDVTEEATHVRLVEAALSHFGGLDIAVNNAGSVGAVRPVAEITASEWQETLAANLTSAFLAARHQIPPCCKVTVDRWSSPPPSSAPASASPAWPPMAPRKPD